MSTKLEQSVKENSTPKDFYEKYQNRLASLPALLSIDELITLLEAQKKEGFTHIQLDRFKESVDILKLKERTSEELHAYRLSRVQHPILRWFKDGLRRAEYMLNEKELSLTKYKEKVSAVKGKVDPSMLAKLKHKEARVVLYQEKIDEIKHIISHTGEYTFQELEELPSKYFTKGSGWLKFD